MYGNHFFCTYTSIHTHYDLCYIIEISLVLAITFVSNFKFTVTRMLYYTFQSLLPIKTKMAHSNMFDFDKMTIKSNLLRLSQNSRHELFCCLSQCTIAQ